MNKKIKNKLIYVGLTWTKSWKCIWFGVNNCFSVDVGKWFIRIFLKFYDLHFCRYFGYIKKESNE